MKVRFFFIALLFLSNFSYTKEIIIKDVLGRESVLKELPQRIILGFYFTDFIAVGGEDSLNRVAGISKGAWSVKTPSAWELYSQALPRLKKITDVGEVELGTFSVEKILSLKADLIMLADWQYQAIKNDMGLIERAGIPIVVIDYNKELPSLHILSTQILGQITGQEKRAEELCAFYKTTLEQIQSTIAKANRAKPKVYVEFGNKGPSEHSFTFGENMWGTIVELAMGENVAKPYIKQWGVINPERVLVSKPDVIFISGRETELHTSQEAMVMGVDIDSKEAQKRLDRFKERKGWDSLPAIENNRLFGLYHGISRTLSDVLMVQYIANVLYPDLFGDFDFQKAYVDFHQKYLPVVPSGTFVIQASEG